jgi:hypothetical protein
MPDEAAAFDDLVEEFFSVWFRYHPDVAAEAGIGGFERLLPPQSDDELAALGAWLETLVVALEELDYGALDPARRLDLRLMFGAARVEHRELLEPSWRHRDPLRLLPVAEIYHLTLQPPADIRDVLATLLGALPEYLRFALSQLRPAAELVAPDLVRAAVDEAESGRCYLRELVASPWLRRNCYGFSEIESLADGACSALASYGEALRGEVAPRAAGRLGCGEAHLRFLFRHRHFMELDDLGARNRLGEALARTQEALASLCASRGIPPERAWEQLRARRVATSGRLETCRSESGRLAELLRESGLVSLPDAELRVSERPTCPRPGYLGSNYRADPGRGRGTYFLDAADADGDEPLACLRARCLDNTWCGSHLLAFAAGEAGWRLPRRFCDGSSLSGAWGLYVRGRLSESDGLEADEQLACLLHRRDAIRRGLLDLDLHTGAIADAEAGARLSDLGGCGGSDPVALARRPGEALAGVLGWLDLTRARELVSAREGRGFSERAFHDRLLSAGTVPLSLVLDAELGVDPLAAG